MIETLIARYVTEGSPLVVEWTGEAFVLALGNQKVTSATLGAAAAMLADALAAENAGKPSPKIETK